MLSLCVPWHVCAALLKLQHRKLQELTLRPAAVWSVCACVHAGAQHSLAATGTAHQRVTPSCLTWVSMKQPCACCPQ
jgi:hypothetical protein